MPWNTTSNIELSEGDLVYFRYYVEVVGPILDLFDPERHFSNAVPHLAVRNMGLLKSILAVAARHMSLGSNDIDDVGPRNTPSPDTGYQGGQANLEPARMATQFYYETLQYLSHTLLYPSYADSHEILATAVMISTYEMFDANGSSTNGDWERHLRGAFWIQRSQNNNGESTDGLRRAVWWAWLRQDIWAAFRSGRRTLTIFQPRKRIQDLSSDELLTRILFIAAKCVDNGWTMGAGCFGLSRNGAKRYQPHFPLSPRPLPQSLHPGQAPSLSPRHPLIILAKVRPLL
ncbi:hypothetical protein EsH8_X_000119 [Colletotrichum jinshuiense]